MIFIAIGICLINAAYYILLRRLDSVWPPFLLGATFRIECLVLFALSLGRQGRLGLLLGLPVRQHVKWLLTVAACNFLLESATIVGLRYTTALNAALLSRLDVIFAVVLGMVVYGERFTGRDVPALFLLGIGCLAVLNTKLQLAHDHVFGDALVIFASAVVASNAFIIRFKLRKLQPDVIAFHNVLYSTVPFALLSMREQPQPLVPRDLALLGLLGATVFGSYVLYYAALRSMPVWRVRALLLSVPAIVMIAGVLSLTDRMPTGWQVAGAALVVFGSVLLLKQHARTPSDKPGGLSPTGESGQTFTEPT